MRRLWFALAVAGFIVMLAAVTVCFSMKDLSRASPSSVRQKRYSVPVAEGVRYRDFAHLGIDRFTFKSCRIEKRRSGALTLGAFNVLVVEGLTVNIPVFSGRTTLSENAGADDFAERFLLSQGFVAGRFSGLRVNGLTVNRCFSNRVERVFTAARAESGIGKKEGLKLRGCVVPAPGGSETRVAEARLVMEPDLTLVYQQGGAERRVAVR